jgi:hypothetical protein
MCKTGEALNGSGRTCIPPKGDDSFAMLICEELVIDQACCGVCEAGKEGTVVVLALCGVTEHYMRAVVVSMLGWRSDELVERCFLDANDNVGCFKGRVKFRSGLTN